jgi:hypothetical protein
MANVPLSFNGPTATTVLPNLSSQPTLQIRSQPAEQKDDQPQATINVFDRLKLCLVKYLNCEDELSVNLNNITIPFLKQVFSKEITPPQVIQAALKCKQVLEHYLISDLDCALLKDPVVFRGWKVDRWQLEDYISLHKYINKEDPIPSPFDEEPMSSDDIQSWDFAKEVIAILKLIPKIDANLEVNAAEFEHISNQADTVTPQQDEQGAHIRYYAYQKMGRDAVRIKRAKTRKANFLIELAARRIHNRQILDAIIQEEATFILNKLAEAQAHIDEKNAEVEAEREKLKKLEAELKVALQKVKEVEENNIKLEAQNAKHERELQEARNNYIQLCHAIERMREELRRCKKKPWWQIF